MGYLQLGVAELAVKRDEAVLERSGCATRHTFRLVPEYRITLVIPVHHIIGFVHGKALENDVCIKNSE